MIVLEVLDRFISEVRGQALRAGTGYAREARVGDFVGSPESVSTVVRGRTGDFEVALWLEGGELQHRCTCPSWRAPCKHEVAAALIYRQILTGTTRDQIVTDLQNLSASRSGAIVTEPGGTTRPVLVIGWCTQ